MKRVHSFSLLVDKYLVVLYYVYNKSAGNEGVNMIIKIDFQSDEALYIQLRNQIILGVATSTLQGRGTRFPQYASWQRMWESILTP